MAVSIDIVTKDLKKLKLDVMAANLDTILDEAGRKNLGVLAVIKRLVDMECEERWKNSIGRRFTLSKLTEKVSIDPFDFRHHKSREEQKSKILGLLDLGFVREKKDIIFIGNPGTGKTMLAKCIALAACNANFKVLFTTAIDMINHLVAANADRSLLKKLQQYQSPDLLV